MAHHLFDPEIALEFGVPEAIVLQNIAFWVAHNEEIHSENHLQDGR